MGLHTIELGELVESGFPIFDFNYPCVAGYRAEFEMKFLLHFYDREINFTSPDKFKRRLAAKLNTIMPYYVQLQMTQNLIENPFRTYKMVECTDRKADEAAFAKSLDSAVLIDGIKVRDDRVNDLISNERMKQHEEGSEDGTLDRDTSDKKQTDFTSKENTHQKTEEHTDRVTDTKHDNDVTSDGTKGVKGTLDETRKGDEDVEESKTVTTKEDETSHEKEVQTGADTTLFSDTPQENFVIGDYDDNGNPLSVYATTYTRVNHSNNKNTDGTKDKDTVESTALTTGKSDETTIDQDTTEDTSTHDKTVTDETTKEVMSQDVYGTLEKEVDYKSGQTENASGTQDDVTHGEHEEDVDRVTDFKQHDTTLGHQFTDREARTGDSKDSQRLTRNEAIERYGYEGYKQVTESSMLQSFRATFLNIDRDIFAECEVLFLGVY